MASYRDLVKVWFETGDKPTQTQFWTLFDRLRFLDEGIDISFIDGLTEILNLKCDISVFDAHVGGELRNYTTDSIYTLPAGYFLEKFIVLPSSFISLKIGSTDGGDEIAAEDGIGPEGQEYVVNMYADVDRLIYLQGISVSTNIIFLKRKLTTA